MLQFLLLFSLGIVFVFFLYLLKDASLFRLRHVLIINFSIIWWISYPLRGFLVGMGVVQVQAPIKAGEGFCEAAVLLSIMFYLVLIAGYVCFRPSYDKEIFSESQLESRRDIYALFVLFFLALFGWKEVFFETGKFVVFVGNMQNEARVGRGILFLLMEILSFAYIAYFSARIVSKKICFQRRDGFVLSMMFVTSSVLCVCLSTRREIGCFFLLLYFCFCIRKNKMVVGLYVMPVVIVLAGPCLQVVKYINFREFEFWTTLFNIVIAWTPNEMFLTVLSSSFEGGWSPGSLSRNCYTRTDLNRC